LRNRSFSLNALQRRVADLHGDDAVIHCAQVFAIKHRHLANRYIPVDINCQLPVNVEFTPEESCKTQVSGIGRNEEVSVIHPFTWPSQHIFIEQHIFFCQPDGPVIVIRDA